MDDTVLLNKLTALLKASEIKIRKEVLEDSCGGLCRIGNERVLFLDSQSLPEEQAVVCARAICEVVDIENIYLLPDVREFIEHQK